jgi:hypothetical protein
LQQFYGLFLSVFPPQPNDPHRLVTVPFRLQCHPQLLRDNDIPLVYLSSLSGTATYFNRGKSLYTAFTVYFYTSLRRYWTIDRPFFYFKELYRFRLFYKIKKHFLYFQIFIKLFFRHT